MKICKKCGKSFEENQEGITEAQGMTLFAVAAKNGWSKDEVKKYADTLGYVRLSEMSLWDFEDTMKYFSENKKEDIKKHEK